MTNLPSIDLVEKLLESVKALSPLDTNSERDEVSELRENIVLALECKALPELRSNGRLPVFVGVQGGTNVGKSTVFNALAGHILSPSVVQASATKHPLVFAHECWREALTQPDAFPGLICRELSDPKELIIGGDEPELIYFRFHSDDSLRRWAIIDSPDFDSTLAMNLRVAKYVATLSDITVYVTTRQKYKDRELVRHLESLLKMKAHVFLLFNMLNEDIVYKTLLDDLSSTVDLPADFTAMRVPSIQSAQPEEEISQLISDPIRACLTSRTSEEIKPRLIEKHLIKAVEQVRELTKLFSRDLGLKARFASHLEKHIQATTTAYREGFQLSLPEETMAIRKILGITELWPFLVLRSEVEKASTPLSFFGSGLKKASDMVRVLMLRLSRKDEGSVDNTTEALAEYAAARDKTDCEQSSHLGLNLRQEIEAFFRDNEKSSPLARRTLGEYFNPAANRAFPDLFRGEIESQVDERRDRGEKVLEHVEKWIESHPTLRRLISIAAIAAKFGFGLITAYFAPTAGTFTILAFVFGYLLAAYGIALVVSFGVRRKKRFREARIEGFQKAIELAFSAPLRQRVESILEEDDIHRLKRTADLIAGDLIPQAAEPAGTP